MTESSTRLREARIELWHATEWPAYDPKGKAIPIFVPIDDHTYPDSLQNPKPKVIDDGILGIQVVAAQTGGGELETRTI